MQFIGTKTPKDMVRENLQLAIKEYGIKLSTINKITGIDMNWLSNYLNGSKERDELSIEESGLLWEITIFLSGGIKMVSEDERIKGVIDILTQIFEIDYKTISLYSGLKEQDIESFMTNTNSIDCEKKYKLATTSMMLHYLFKNPNSSIKAN